MICTSIYLWELSVTNGIIKWPTNPNSVKYLFFFICIYHENHYGIRYKNNTAFSLHAVEQYYFISAETSRLAMDHQMCLGNHPALQMYMIILPY